MGLFSRNNKALEAVRADDAPFEPLRRRPRNTRKARAPLDANTDAPPPLDPAETAKTRARRRLIGAVALALAAIVFVPMLFDRTPIAASDDIALNIPDRETPFEGRRGVPDPARGPLKASSDLPSAAPGPVAPVASTDAGKPVPQPTIDQSADKVATQGGADKAGPAPDAGAAAVPEPTTVKGAERASAAKASAESSKSAADATKSTDATKTAEAAKTTEAAKATETPKAAEAAKAAEATKAAKAAKAAEATRTAEATKAASEPARPASPSGDDPRAVAALEGHGEAAATPAEPAARSYAVQIAAFSAAERARGLRDQLVASGLRSYTESVSTAQGLRTRVRLGPFASREAADHAKQKLKTMKLDGSVVPL